jgi:hypothetical protein
MDNALKKMLQNFADSANKTQLRPEDYLRFCDLSIYIHQHALNISGPQIAIFLSGCGFPADAALGLGVKYERFREILARDNRYDISSVLA